MSGDQERLRPIFAPASIAVMGATDDRTKVGFRPVFLLRKFKWAGRLYPVSPTRVEVQGLKAWASLDELPEVPELVVVAVPARDVVALAGHCASIGVKAIIIYSSGFAEVSAEGARAEEDLRALSRSSGMLIAGPNCQGIADFGTGMVSNFTSALMNADVPAGPVALLAQSGMVGGIMLSAALKQGLGLRYLASTGNEAGFTLADTILYAAADPEVRVISGYVEEIRDFDAFRRAALEARRRGITVVMLKVGDSPAGNRAARLHTGSDTGERERYDALFAETGVVRAESLDALIALTDVFAKVTVLPRGNRVGVLTNSGGLGVYSADVITAEGLELSPFTEATAEFVRARLLAFGSSANPVDISTQAFIDPASVQECLEQICADPAIDIISVTFGLQLMNGEAVARGIVEAARKTPDKPLLVAWIYSDPAGEALLKEAGLPVFFDPKMALHCAGVMNRVALNTAAFKTRELS